MRTAIIAFLLLLVSSPLFAQTTTVDNSGVVTSVYANRTSTFTADQTFGDGATDTASKKCVFVADDGGTNMSGYVMVHNDTGGNGPALLFATPDQSSGTAADFMYLINDEGEHFVLFSVDGTHLGAEGQNRVGDIWSTGTISTTGDLNAAGGGTTELTYWYQDNVTASQTDVVINMDGNTGRAEVPTVRAGSVIGVAVYSNAARTAGTLTVDVTVDGTKTGLTAVLDGTNPQTKTTTQAKDTDVFTAGQRIGVKITTDGTWAPITADTTVVVLVEQ